MPKKKQQVLAVAKVVDLLLVNASMEDADLRASMVSQGAPPWVRNLGVGFLYRDACSGHMMYAVSPPQDPEIRLFEADTWQEPTYEGRLSEVGFEDEERLEIWRSLFTTPAGCWTDDLGFSVSLKLDA